MCTACTVKPACNNETACDRAGLAMAQSGLALEVRRTSIHYQPHGYAMRSPAVLIRGLRPPKTPGLVFTN